MKQTTILCDLCKQTTEPGKTLDVHHLQTGARHAKFGSPFNICPACVESRSLKELFAACFPPLPEKPKPELKPARPSPDAVKSAQPEPETTQGA